ncbi:MAG TPA: porin [Daejeonella sp.]|uniref:porin n=1 Tax=Daejeonella sp. TaxID=2805397 RepID=UPI002ED7EE27
MKTLLTLALGLASASLTFAQDEPKIKVSGYLETYFGYDYNKPADNNRPGFVYSHNRHNEVNLNLGFIKGAYDNGTVRGNLALMAGTYTNANLAAEPGVLKNIFEANAGLKLSKTANLWVDAGIFASHIGFESAISKDCWVLTRNIVSDNTPYYESGAKITYGTSDNKFTVAFLYLNGWQRINRLSGNSQPAGGLQLTFKPTDKITLNYSNYLGTEGEDAVRVRRFYNNFYGIFQITDKFGLIAGFDYGTQQIAKGSNQKNEVLAPVAIAQYKFNPKWALAGRLEYYEDANGVIISTGTPEGFKTTGYSMNIDYWPVSNAVLRLEGKVLDSKDKIFVRETIPVSNSSTLTASIAVSF